MATLGRVTDIDALDADEGARAFLAIEVPTAWLAEGAEIEVTTPRLLACDRCGGGGCDGCGRSGALRGPAEAAARTICVRLPQSDGDGPIGMRIPAPFDDGDIAQIILTVTPSEAPSGGVVRRGAPPAKAASIWWAAALAAAAAAAWLLW